MTRKPTFEQETAIMQLNKGDIIKIRCNGKEEECEFVDSKQVNMVCIINDKAYNVPKVCYVDVISKAEKKTSANISLKKGELFIVNINGKAQVLSFQEKNGTFITGICPVNKIKTRVLVSSYVDSVKNIQKELLKAE